MDCDKSWEGWYHGAHLVKRHTYIHRTTPANPATTHPWHMQPRPRVGTCAGVPNVHAPAFIPSAGGSGCDSKTEATGLGPGPDSGPGPHTTPGAPRCQFGDLMVDALLPLRSQRVSSWFLFPPATPPPTGPLAPLLASVFPGGNVLWPPPPPPPPPPAAHVRRPFGASPLVFPSLLGRAKPRSVGDPKDTIDDYDYNYDYDDDDYVDDKAEAGDTDASVEDRVLRGMVPLTELWGPAPTDSTRPARPKTECEALKPHSSARVGLIAKISVEGNLMVKFLAKNEVTCGAAIVNMASLLRDNKWGQPTAAQFVHWDLFSEPTLRAKPDTEGAVLLADSLPFSTSVEYEPKNYAMLQKWKVALGGPLDKYGFAPDTVVVRLF